MIPLNLAHELMLLCDHFQFSSTAPVDADNNRFTFDQSPLSGLRTLTVTTLLGDTEAFVMNNGAGDLIVAFRGSEAPFADPGGWQDWMGTDFHSNRMAYPPAPGFWPDQRWVHRGFWEAYDSIAVLLVTLVLEQVALHGIKRIFVTGHSLGGAIAYLAAMHLSSAFPALRVHLYSFAAPRVGDIGLNHLMQRSVTSTFFVLLEGDPVPHLPPFGPNFPVTLKQVFRLQVGPYTVGFGNVLPQLFQNYDTGQEVVYIDKDLNIQDHLPVGEVAVSFDRHMPNVYRDTIGTIAGLTTPPPPTLTEFIEQKKENMAPVLHSAMQP